MADKMKLHEEMNNGRLAGIALEFVSDVLAEMREAAYNQMIASYKSGSLDGLTVGRLAAIDEIEFELRKRVKRGQLSAVKFMEEETQNDN